MKRLPRLLLPLFFALPALADPGQPIAEVTSKFDALASQMFQESGAPGASVAIVYKGEVVYRKGFGVRKAGETAPVDADTVFQLASCSKPISSTGVAALVSQGKLKWEDRIQAAYPEFAVGDSWIASHLTYRDLLSHHSGLPEFAGDILEDLGYSRGEILHRLRLLPTAYAFRDGYAYTNFGFTAGAEAASRAAGLSYEDMMQQTVFGPLGMTSTSARFEDFVAHPNHASTHQVSKGKAVPTVRMPQAQAPAGGVSSSATDMARWMNLHLAKGKVDGQELISPEALGETYQIHSVTGKNPANFSASGYYGLGWNVSFDERGRMKLGHSGAFEIGARTAVTLLPQEEVGIVVLTNSYPNALPEALSASFMKLYDGQTAYLYIARKLNGQVNPMLETMLGGEPPATPPSRPSPPQALGSYQATYANEFYGDAQVVAGAGGLVLKLNGKSFDLKHRDRDVFLAQAAPGVFEDLSSFEVQFATDGGGRVTGFRQHGLAEPFPWFGRQ